MAGKKRGGGGGFFSGLSNLIYFILLAAIIFGGLGAFAKVNNIQSASDIVSFLRAKSAETKDTSKPCVLSYGKDCGNILDEMDDSGDSGNPTDGSGEEEKQKPANIEVLNGLPTVNMDPNSGYSRKGWLPRWQGSPCDAREEILKRDGKGVESDSSCRPTSGTWVSPYDNVTVTDSSKVDIDHIIPLSAASQRGAESWDQAKKSQFANDPENLVAVSQSSNRQKGDKGPSEWMPSNKDYQCTYAENWVKVAQKYQLGLTAEDKASLEQTLSQC